MKEILLSLETYTKYIYDDIIDEGINVEAKQSLIIFFRELKKTRPDTEYRQGYVNHLGYIPYLLRIRDAFLENNYCLVAHEIVTVFHYEQCLQPRIYNNLLHILEEHLNKGG